jgi:hypothetical protein
MAAPMRRQPPGTLRHACNVPCVLAVDAATTVITCVAAPVLKCSGNDAACGSGAGGVGVGVAARGVGRSADASGIADVDAGRGRGVVLDAVGTDDDDLGVTAAVVGSAADPLEQAAAHQASTTTPAICSLIAYSQSRAARPAAPDRSYGMPINIRGCAVGCSQRISRTSFHCGIATQPAVAVPSVTCRKNALPAPCTTPVGELRVL